MKKLFLLITVIALTFALTFGLTSCAKDYAVGEEILKNADFSEKIENSEGKSVLADWTYHYGNNGTVSTGTEQDGNKIVKLKNSENSFTYVSQRVSLKKGGTYRISATINVPSAISGNAGYAGAYIGFLQNPDIAVRQQKTATGGNQKYEVYFTCDTLASFDLILALGSDEHPSKGEVSFFNLSLVRVDPDSVPETASVLSLTRKTNLSEKTAKGVWFTVIAAVLSLVVVIGCYYGIKSVMSKKDDEKDGKKSFLAKFGGLILLLVNALLLRVLLAALTYGSPEVKALLAWAERLTEYGSGGFYSYFATAEALPVTLYATWIAGFAVKLFSASGQAALFIMRLPLIIADVLGVYFVYKIAGKHNNEKIAFFVALMYAFLPFALTIVGIWGTGISFASLFILLAFDKLLDKKFITFSVYYGLALASSTFAAFLLPIVLAYFVYIFIRENKARLTLILCVVGIFVGLYVVSLPFTFGKLSENVMYFYSHYIDLFSAKNYYTMNVANIYTLFGLNYSIVSSPSKWLNLLLLALISAFTIFIYFKNRNRTELVILSAFQLAMIYVFSVRMNNSYLLPVLILLLLYAVVTNEKRAYFLFGGYSFLGILNAGTALAKTEVFGATSAPGSFVSIGSNAWAIVLSVAFILLTVYFAYVVYDICINSRRYDVEQFGETYKIGGIKALLKRKKR